MNPIVKKFRGVFVSGIIVSGIFLSLAAPSFAQSGKTQKKAKKPQAAATDTKSSAEPDKVLYERSMVEYKKGKYTEARLDLQTLINTYPDSEYLAKAQRQQQRIFEISPMRGPIYDRKGRELAVSLPMDSVFGDPAEIADVETVSQLLSRVLGVSADDLSEKLREARTPVRLARKLSPEIVQRITDMNLKGVFFQKENRRVYPQRELAASVLGYVDVDEKK